MKRYEGGAHHAVTFVLNGVPRRGHCEPRMLLSDFLREEIGATGVHVGCEHGICGACTVRVDGVAVRSCLVLAVQVEGCQVHTVEGLAPAPDALGDLQAAFKRHHALQCGFCTPGILMACDEFLSRVAAPSEEDVRALLSAHLCRCTGYTNLVRAVLEVAAERRT